MVCLLICVETCVLLLICDLRGCVCWFPVLVVSLRALVAGCCAVDFW